MPPHWPHWLTVPVAVDVGDVVVAVVVAPGVVDVVRVVVAVGVGKDTLLGPSTQGLSNSSWWVLERGQLWTSLYFRQWNRRGIHTMAWACSAYVQLSITLESEKPALHYARILLVI